ncbi:MAG TPA: aromatic ring-hydroxylating dioxygenase subunit alpha [Pseudomonadales bacterium]|nr:aromatic ring-hydroxylating dioxygenase subunit alpha [Pseudomonadales bacterium]
MSAVRADVDAQPVIEPYVVEDKSRGLFRVNRRVFVDANVLERERRLIFDKCWLYVGHESEIAQPGAFLTRTVGGRELIFVRGKDARVRAFFNTCPHRGAMVCREKSGNEKLFRCFYHAWAFDLQGKLVARPGAERYAEGTRVDGVHDLVPVPQLDQYRGLYFVNYDRNAVDLVTYLAGAAEFIDLVMDQSDVGMEIVGGTQEYGFAANWKLLCENSIDGYHGMPTHATYFDYVMASGGQLGENLTTVNKPNDLGNGHAVIEYGAPWGRPVAKPVKAWGEQGDVDTTEIRARLEQRFGKARAERIAYQNRNMLIFPNLVINDIMAVTVRTFFPVAPGQQNVSAWALAPKEENALMRERRLYNYLEFLGPGGFATPDDCEALALCQRGYNNLTMASWNDISKGMHEANPIIEDEAQMRVFWREWNRRMAGAAA